jgi:hypothetical protein
MAFLRLSNPENAQLAVGGMNISSRTVRPDEIVVRRCLAFYGTVGNVMPRKAPLHENDVPRHASIEQTRHHLVGPRMLCALEMFYHICQKLAAHSGSAIAIDATHLLLTEGIADRRGFWAKETL